MEHKYSAAPSRGRVGGCTALAPTIFMANSITALDVDSIIDSGWRYLTEHIRALESDSASCMNTVIPFLCALSHT